MYFVIGGIGSAMVGAAALIWVFADINRPRETNASPVDRRVETPIQQTNAASKRKCEPPKYLRRNPDGTNVYSIDMDCTD